MHCATFGEISKNLNIISPQHMLNSVEKIGLAEGHRKQCRHYINIIFLITCDLLQKEYYVICFSALSSAGLCL